jgi:hypothetical protein
LVNREKDEAGGPTGVNGKRTKREVPESMRLKRKWLGLRYRRNVSLDHQMRERGWPEANDAAKQ